MYSTQVRSSDWDGGGRGFMSSPRLLRKFGKQRAFRVLMLGQAGVGKSAMTVRFITKRYIGEYDPTLEKKYRYTADVDNETVAYEILDTAGQEEVSIRMEENIRWADAFILMYDICDMCSFMECTRLKFLIQYAKKTRRPSSSTSNAEALVFLVGNKSDLQYDRMMSTLEGQAKADTLGCPRFYEISVRESCDDVIAVFHELYRLGKELRRPWLARSFSTRDRASSLDDCTPSAGDGHFLTPEEAEKSPRRKTSVTRIIRKMLPSGRGSHEDHGQSSEEGAYGGEMA